MSLLHPIKKICFGKYQTGEISVNLIDKNNTCFLLYPNGQLVRIQDPSWCDLGQNCIKTPDGITVQFIVKNYQRLVEQVKPVFMKPDFFQVQLPKVSDFLNQLWSKSKSKLSKLSPIQLRDKATGTQFRQVQDKATGTQFRQVQDMGTETQTDLNLTDTETETETETEKEKISSKKPVVQTQRRLSHFEVIGPIYQLLKESTYILDCQDQYNQELVKHKPRYQRINTMAMIIKLVAHLSDQLKLDPDLETLGLAVMAEDFDQIDRITDIIVTKILKYRGLSKLCRKLYKNI